MDEKMISCQQNGGHKKMTDEEIKTSCSPD